MTGAKELIEKLASFEKGRSEFLAPVVRGHKVRARLPEHGGLVRAYDVQRPADNEHDRDGFFIVHPIDEKRVAIIDTPRPALVEKFLERLPQRRLILLREKQQGRFDAIAWNAGGALGFVDVVFCVGVGVFDVVVARVDGGLCYFHDRAHNVDDRVAEQLRADVAAKKTAPSTTKGLTPELRAAFDLHAVRLEAARAGDARQHLIEQARLAGAVVEDIVDGGDVWHVTLTTPFRQRHTVAVLKRDGAIASSGICLSGRDRDFDLASIISVLDDEYR